MIEPGLLQRTQVSLFTFRNVFWREGSGVIVILDALRGCKSVIGVPGVMYVSIGT